jgi:hypothetical protein
MQRDGRRCAPIHPGCSGSPVAAHPIPCHQKKRGSDTRLNGVTLSAKIT